MLESGKRSSSVTHRWSWHCRSPGCRRWTAWRWRGLSWCRSSDPWRTPRRPSQGPSAWRRSYPGKCRPLGTRRTSWPFLLEGEKRLYLRVGSKQGVKIFTQEEKRQQWNDARVSLSCDFGKMYYALIWLSALIALTPRAISGREENSRDILIVACTLSPLCLTRNNLSREAIPQGIFVWYDATWGHAYHSTQSMNL